MKQREFQDLLDTSNHTEDELKSILISAQIDVSKINDRKELIQKLIAEIWSSSHTPIGQVLKPHTLGDIIHHITKKLDLQLPDCDNDLDLLDAFTSELLPTQTEISIEDLPKDLQEQLKTSLTQTVLGLGTTSTSIASRFLGKKVLELLALPLLQWLRLLPKVGPILISIRGAANMVVGLSGPIGIAATLWTINSMLGPKWDRCITLLLGIGLLRRLDRQLAS